MSAAVQLCKVYFDPPVMSEIRPVSKSGRRAEYTYNEITTISKKLRDDGWDHRAVVAERQTYATGAIKTYECANPKNWGFVMELRTCSTHNRPYFPLKVLWHNGKEGEYWPEDLFLIHGAVTQYALDEDFKEQMKNDKPV